MDRSEHFDPYETRAPLDSRSLSTAEIFREIAAKATLLVRKEIDLLRQESKEDVRSEIAALKSLAATAVAAIATLNLLLTAAVFALASHMTALRAALLLAGLALVITIAAGAIARHKHVKKPLDRTRKTVKEDVHWAKEQMA